jgi:hypothetical protein
MSQEVYKRLRSFLNPFIKGPFVNALIEALADSDTINEANILEVKKNLLVATAEERFLDKLASRYGITRPQGVGMDDDSFRELVSTISNKQLITNVFLNILEQFYGEEATHANVINGIAGPYALVDGMDLYVQSEAGKIVRVEFKSADFTNISQATALEIAQVISRFAIDAGETFYAQQYIDQVSGDYFIQLFSGTRGPKSAISVVGGSAQPVLLFPTVRSTTQVGGGSATQFTSSQINGRVRYTWTGGSNPSLQFVQIGDYVTIKSTPFPADEAGTYTIEAVYPAGLGAAYFEVANPIAVAGVSTLITSSSDIMFFSPKKFTLNSLARKASIYEVNPREIVAYIPATARIVRRSLEGAWNIHGTSTNRDYLGSYLFNPKSGYTIGGVSSTPAQTISAGRVYPVIQTASSVSNFPDQTGYVVFDYGTSNEEGPVKYLGRASNNSLLMDASYIYKKNHVGGTMDLIRTLRPYAPSVDGKDYPTYLTGTIAGRIAAEDLINEIAAAGISITIIVVYPAGPGLLSNTRPFDPDIP